MRSGGLHIPKGLLLTADVMNTLFGGMSRPVVLMERMKDKYIVRARIPGVKPGNMQIEVRNNLLFIFHHITISNPGYYEGISTVPFNIGYVLIPYDVNIPGIKALFEGHELIVSMPFNELANGYHKRINIDKG